MMKAKLKPLLRACTAFTCAAVLMASPVLVYAEDSVADLEKETQDLQSELQDLNEQLSSISGEITSLAAKIESTNKEAEQTELDLAAAQVNEDLQYQSMKKRIQYIYESGNVSFLEILLTSDSMGEFLNRVDFVSSVTEYDRKMLKQLQDLRQDIDQKEKNLKKQKEELDAMKQQMTSKQAELNSRIESTNGQLTASSQALAAAKAAEEAAKKHWKRQQTLTMQPVRANSNQILLLTKTPAKANHLLTISRRHLLRNLRIPRSLPAEIPPAAQITAAITIRLIQEIRSRRPIIQLPRSLLLLPKQATSFCLRQFWNARQAEADTTGFSLLLPSL